MTRSTCYLVHLYIFSHRDDEHALILQYCQTLGGEGSPCSQPQSPAQILQAVEREERGELERIIQRLEDEQRYAIGQRSSLSNVSATVFRPLTKSDAQHTHTHRHTLSHSALAPPPFISLYLYLFDWWIEVV